MFCIEWCSFNLQDSLLHYLREKGQSISKKQRISMCLHVAKGMAYLHQEKYIHRYNLSVPSYCLHHIWTIDKKNTHTCLRNTTDIQDMIVKKISFYTGEKVTVKKTYFCYNGKCWHILSIRKSIFHCCHPFIYVCCNEKSHWTLLFLAIYYNLIS